MALKSIDAGGPPGPPLCQIKHKSRVANSLKWVAELLQAPFYRASEPTLRTYASIMPSKAMSRVYAYGVMALGMLAMATLLAPALLGGLLYLASDLFAPNPFTHLRGEAGEVSLSTTLKVLTLNVCMFPGGLPYLLGGLSPANHRIEQLAQLIKESDPDIVVFQEMSYPASLQLVERIQGAFSHIFTRIGPNAPFGMESALFAATKTSVLSAGFIPFDDQGAILRGAFWIDTPSAVIFTTHLEHGQHNQSMRCAQLGKIQAQMAKFDKPCLLLGDLNIDRLEQGCYEDSGLCYNYNNPIPKGVPTCTEILNAKIRSAPIPQKVEEQLDYALQKKFIGPQLEMSVEVIDTYADHNPSTALSDHKALLLTVRPERIKRKSTD